MTKNKIIGIISGIIIATSFVVITNMNNTKNINKVLLAAPSTNQGIVVNTNKSPLVVYKTANESGQSNIEGYISVGETLNIESEVNGFYKVKINETGITGYVATDHVEKIVSGEGQACSSINMIGYTINTNSKVALKENPSVTANTVMELGDFNKLSVLGKQGDWYKVSVSGKTGYIFDNYVGLTSLTISQADVNNTKDNTNAIKVKPKVPGVINGHTVVNEVILSKDGTKTIVPEKVVFDGSDLNIKNLKSLALPKNYAITGFKVYNNGQLVETSNSIISSTDSINESLIGTNLKAGNITIKYYVTEIDTIKSNNQNTKNTQPKTGSAYQSSAVTFANYYGTWMPNLVIGVNQSADQNTTLTSTQVQDKKLVLTKDLYSFNGVTIKNPNYYAVNFYTSDAFNSSQLINYSMNDGSMGGKFTLIIALPQGAKFNAADYSADSITKYPAISDNKILAFVGNQGQVYGYIK